VRSAGQGWAGLALGGDAGHRRPFAGFGAGGVGHLRFLDAAAEDDPAAAWVLGGGG